MGASISSILDPLRANAERHPDELLFAFLDADGRTRQSYTYEAFLRQTGDVAAHLHSSCPLARGERALLVYPPGLEMIVALYACVRLGWIPVPVYPPSSHGFTAALRRMNAIAQDCGAAAVLTDRSYYWSMKMHRARTFAARSFARDDADYSAKLEWIVTSDAEANARARFPELHSDILFLQYTSGSTSEPKGVMVTHANVLANCEGVVDHTPVAVSWLPQYHDMGLIAFYMFSVIKGGTTYGSSPVDFIERPLLWLEAMTRFRATASAAPSFAYEYCLRPDKVDDESLARLDLSSLRVLLNGAEPVKADVFASFLRRFEPCGLGPTSFSTAYGLAENTLAVSTRGRAARAFDAGALERNRAVARRDSKESKTLISCGAPIESTDVRIVDATARTLPEGRVGELWVSGPSKCLGYWGRPELSREVFAATIDGDPEPERTWLRTGDLGFLRDGELFVCGRSKDLIIIRGANYYPQDVESVVEEEPAVRRGCVAAFSVEVDGNEGVVVVAELRNQGRVPDVQQLHRRIRARVGLSVHTFAFVPKRAVPKTSSGKISRHRAKAMWLEGGFDVVCLAAMNGGPGNSADVDTESHVLSPLERLFRGYGLRGDEDLTLLESGLDSLSLVDFSLDVEKHLQSLEAAELAEAVQVRWLQKLPVCELYDLLHQVDSAAPHTKLRFRQAFQALAREHLEAERELMRRDSRLTLDGPTGPARAPEAASAGGGVLLTAGTGFFGPFLLRSLLEQGAHPIHVLVRARDAEHGMQRLAEGLASLGIPLGRGPLDGWRRRVIPVPGDLAQPRLGLSPAAWQSLADTVHAVYHNGALVNYLLDYASMRDANVGATREIVRLVASGRPKALNHISSTFVFGWSTRENLFETDTNADMESLDFGYSQTKWVSEQIVLGAMSRGLEARIFRPALITPSVAGGGHNFDIAIRLLAFMVDHGISTTAQNQVSFTPADVAANNIVAISSLPDTLGQTFHVTRDEYANLMDVSHILGELTGTGFVNFPVREFVPTMIERCRREDILFPLVDFFVHSADNITAMEFKRYDSTNYRRARARSPLGIADPPLEDVVAGIVRFMRKHGVIRRKPMPALEQV